MNIKYNNQEYYDLEMLENNIVKNLNDLEEEKLRRKIKIKIDNFNNKIFLLGYGLLVGSFYLGSITYVALKGIDYKWSVVLVLMVGFAPILKYGLKRGLNEFVITDMIRFFSQKRIKRLRKDLSLIRQRKLELREQSVKSNQLYNLQEYHDISLDTRVNAERMDLIKRYVLLNNLKKVRIDKPQKSGVLEDKGRLRIRK